MTMPPYIPGLAATTFAVAAAVSLSPSEADGLSEVGFLRWVLVAVTGGGGLLLWRLLSVMEGIRALLDSQSQAKDALLLDVAKQTMKS